MAVLSIEDRVRIERVVRKLQAGGGYRRLDQSSADELAKVFNGNCGFRGCCPGSLVEGLRDAPALTLLRVILCGDEGLVVPNAEGIEISGP